MFNECATSAFQRQGSDRYIGHSSLLPRRATEPIAASLILNIAISEPLLIILEDLKVLRRSPDLFNNVKIGQGQLPLILIKHFLFYHIWGLQPFRLSDLKQSYGYSIKQPSDF